MNDATHTPSPLDTAICITVFPDVFAREKYPEFVSLNAFAERLRDTRAASKAELPLFSPGSYDRKRTAAKALRHDNNLVELFAVVGDYDGEKLSVDAARAALATVGVCAVVVTSPSHTPERPRWRVICPLSDPLNRARANASGFELAEYHRLASRLAGVFADNIAAESWNRSQGWYIGTVNGAPDHQVHLVLGACLDLLAELDATARPRPKPPVKVRAKRGISRRRAEPIPIPGTEGSPSQTQIPDAALALDVRDALAAITDGEGSHQALVGLAGKLVAQGLPKSTVIDLLTYAADQRPDAGRDAGWQKMRADIPRVVAWAFEKEAISTSTALVPIPVLSSGNGAAPPPPPPPGAGSSAPGARPGPQPGTGRMRGMLRSRNPQFAGNLANVITCLLTRPELLGCVAYDQMALDVSLRRALPDNLALAAPRSWTDVDVSQLQDYLQRECSMGRVGRETVQQGVEAVARDYAFHAVRDYLDGLRWDGTKRADTWLSNYLSVESSDYARGYRPYVANRHGRTGHATRLQV